MADRDAGDRAPGTPPPRRATLPLRTRRWVALPSVRDQHHHRTVGVPRSPPPRPRPRRRQHPARERHRPRPLPLPRKREVPHREYGINTTWLLAVAIAADLTAWLRLLALPETLKTCEPKALRYRFLHIPARLTTSGRRRHPPPAGNLALDPGRRRRIHRCDGHPAPDLTTHSALTTATQGPSKTRTAAPRGTPSQPTHNKQHQREHQGINRNPVKDRG